MFEVLADFVKGFASVNLRLPVEAFKALIERCLRLVVQFRLGAGMGRSFDAHAFMVALGTVRGNPVPACKVSLHKT